MVSVFFQSYNSLLIYFLIWSFGEPRMDQTFFKSYPLVVLVLDHPRQKILSIFGYLIWHLKGSDSYLLGDVVVSEPIERVFAS